MFRYRAQKFNDQCDSVMSQGNRAKATPCFIFYGCRRFCRHDARARRHAAGWRYDPYGAPAPAILNYRAQLTSFYFLEPTPGRPYKRGPPPRRRARWLSGGRARISQRRRLMAEIRLGGRRAAGGVTSWRRRLPRWRRALNFKPRCYTRMQGLLPPEVLSAVIPDESTSPTSASRGGWIFHQKSIRRNGIGYGKSCRQAAQIARVAHFSPDARELLYPDCARFGGRRPPAKSTRS